jgi:hypothetical protein
MSDLTEYVKRGEHLPPELRDFHDQKLFFKWLVWEKLAQAQAKLKEEGNDHSASMVEGLDFASAQIFTFDYFLWFMAMFGYKLQRIRKRDLRFYDLGAAMREYSDQLMDQQAAALRRLRDEEEQLDEKEVDV